MQIVLTPATEKERNIVFNLGRFYIYDMYRYCGFLPTWDTPETGLFECKGLARYWTEPNRFPFLIYIDAELAGFVLVHKMGSTSDVDWVMGEFFITSKFQGKGIGKLVAEQVFNRFPGTWEVSQIPENAPAVTFWKRVVSIYTRGQFSEENKIEAEPQPHPMVVLKFNSKELSSVEPNERLPYIRYTENPTEKEEVTLINGLRNQAANIPGLSPIQSFAFFIEGKEILGGIRGYTYYGCLYIDSLWVVEAHRNYGWGTKLVEAAEKIGIERKCQFFLLTTMSWEALSFYQKLGYKIEYTREGYENGAKMHILRKNIKVSQ